MTDMNEEIQKQLNKKLHAAAEKGDVKAIEAALSEGAQIESSFIFDAASITPLIIVAREGFNDACKALIAAGADLQAVSKSGWGALNFAILNGHEDVALTLIEAGARGGDYVAADRQFSPLSEAAAIGMDEVCRKLIARGHDVEEKTWHNRTSLMRAAYNGRISTCRLLLALGANVWAEDCDGKTPLDYAIEDDPRDDGKCVDATIAKHENRRAAGIVLLRAGAPHKGDDTSLQWLRQMYADAKIVFPVGQTPTAQQCFTDDGVSDAVLNACATGQFGNLIGEPLIRAKEYTLFEKIWDALPEYWRQQNQGLHIGYAKREKAITPPIHSIEERRVEL